MPSLPSPFAAGDCPADNFDPDYLYFLRHLRPDGDSYILELPPGGASPASVIKYECPIANSDGECVSDPSPGRGSTNRRTEQRDSSVDAPPSWLDSLVDIDEDYRVFLQHTRVVNNRLRLEIGGVVVDYDPVSDAAQSGGSSGIEEQSEKDAAVDSSGEQDKRIDTDEPVVIVPERNVCDWRADPTPAQRVEGQQAAGHRDAEPRAASVRISLLSDAYYCYIFILLANRTDRRVKNCIWIMLGAVLGLIACYQMMISHVFISKEVDTFMSLDIMTS
jgi:hypothetical protein